MDNWLQGRIVAMGARSLPQRSRRVLRTGAYDARIRLVVTSLTSSSGTPLRFVSLRHLAGQAKETAGRFPLVLLSAITAAAAALYLVDHSDDRGAVRVLLAALLGLPLFTAVVTRGERAVWSRGARAAVQAAAVLLLLALWFVCGTWTDQMRFTRFAHLVVLAHLTVAVLPFMGSTLDRAFWQYNRLLFVRYLVAGLFAAVLFAGLAIALAAIHQLFGVKIDGEWYGRLWIVIALVFHPWFFLGGVPRELNALEARDDYPAGLKVFAQFILIPVVTVYLLILTAYLLRVVVTRTWPSGWIGYLVSSVAVAGTLALLLIHPVRERADSRWVDGYSRWFWVALLPAVGMLLMAIWLRIDQYGVTERRYFLAVLALWLGAIALYYAITASRNIRLIPTTLGALALVTFAGPWSAYAVSLRSQLGRFRQMLAANAIQVSPRLEAASGPIPFDQRREMSSVVRYLVQMHGPTSLRSISDTLSALAAHPPGAQGEPGATGTDDAAARGVLQRLGVSYVAQWESRETARVTNFNAQSPLGIAVEGYEWVTRGNLASTFTITLGTDTLTFAPDSLPQRTIISRGKERLLEIPLWPLVEQARAIQSPDRLRVTPAAAPARGVSGPSSDSASRGSSRQATQQPLVLDAEGNGLRIRIVVASLNATGDSTHARISADATILLHFVGR